MNLPYVQQKSLYYEIRCTRELIVLQIDGIAHPPLFAHIPCFTLSDMVQFVTVTDGPFDADTQCVACAIFKSPDNILVSG